MDDFWKRCVEARCVVVPVKTYSQFRSGKLDEADYIGIKYAGIAVSWGNAVGPDYWFEISRLVKPYQAGAGRAWRPLSRDRRP